jgi:hypothetical protein
VYQEGFAERRDPTPSWLACAQVLILPQSEARSGGLLSFSILDNSTKWQQSTVTEKEELDRQKKAVAEYLFSDDFDLKKDSEKVAGYLQLLNCSLISLLAILFSSRRNFNQLQH